MASKGWYAEKVLKLKKETSKARKESMQISAIDCGKVSRHWDPEVRHLVEMTDAEKCQKAKEEILRNIYARCCV